MRNFLLCILLLFCLACSDNSQQKHHSAAPDLEQEQPAAPNAPDSAKDSALAPDSAFLIIPGKQVGKIYLGDSPQKVIQRLGEPDASNAAMGKAIFSWYGSGTAQTRDEVNVYTVRKNTGMPQETVEVQQIRVTSSRFKVIPFGLSTGSTLKQIRKSFPEAKAVAYYNLKDQQRVFLYDASAQGIAFEMTGPDSLAVAITVHKKNHGAAETYLPVHPNQVQIRQR